MPKSIGSKSLLLHRAQRELITSVVPSEDEHQVS
jgi:hypothetical protein